MGNKSYLKCPAAIRLEVHRKTQNGLEEYGEYVTALEHANVPWPEAV